MDGVFFNSFIAGVAQTIIGHPFDTVKTYKQVYFKKPTIDITKELISKNGISYLYRGFLPPLLGGCIQNGLMFSSESSLRELCNGNNFYSGFLTGCFTSFVISPSELIKTKLQIDKSLSVLSVIKKSNLSRGIGLTMLRDSFGFSIYFGTYYNLQNKNNNPLLNGGITGVLSWIYSYPIDVIKTKYQISSNSTLKEIIKQNNIKTLTSGLNIMLIRSFIVNASIFYIFDTLTNLINK